MAPVVACQALAPDGFHPSVSGTAAPDNRETVSREERRRLRRMISNRESARRSRARKQRHLEELRSQAGRLRLENRDLVVRLGGLIQRCVLVRQDNDCLRAEASALSRRLAELRSAAALRHLQHRLMAAPPHVHAQYELAWASSLMA
ncbi:hypothetical protein Cni_G16575 [Canna indica]|uniref:BZIP domain-containing protein n=1 Tax=Canna indica TaxID=4628 RepID=A0AAQ3KL70_9LILI|nr:hypothetical protein Cni_G16575 [Canna indica]